MTEILDYPRDDLRYKYFVKESNQHQAKMELRTFKWIVEHYTKPGQTILDPMSGVGTVHFANFMGRHTHAIELVPDFVELQKANIKNMLSLWTQDHFYEWMDSWDYTVGGFLSYPLGTPQIHLGDSKRILASFTGQPNIDAVIFSPPYGSLWAYSQPNRDSKIAQEKNYLVGYDQDTAQVGNLKNYTQYLTAMGLIYQGCYDALKPGGVLVTVVKDYIEKGKRVLCSRDNLKLCIAAGFKMEDWHFRRADIVQSPYSKGNRDKRIAAGKHTVDLDINYEDILVVRK